MGNIDISKLKTKTSKRAIEDRIIRGKVLACKLSGMSYQEIAANLGMPINESYAAVRMTMEELPDIPEAELYRKVQLLRYEEIFKSRRARALDQDDDEAAKILLAALAAIDKLLGLNITKIEHTGANGGAIDIVVAAAGVLEQFNMSERFKDVIEAQVVEKAIGVGYIDEQLGKLQQVRLANSLKQITMVSDSTIQSEFDKDEILELEID